MAAVKEEAHSVQKRTLRLTHIKQDGPQRRHHAFTPASCQSEYLFSSDARRMFPLMFLPFSMCVLNKHYQVMLRFIFNFIGGQNLWRLADTSFVYEGFWPKLAKKFWEFFPCDEKHILHKATLNPHKNR